MPNPHVVASIEARMSSSRLPGKVLADIAGMPSLSRLLQRLRRAKLLDSIILATSDRAVDDTLEDWARNERIPFFRGHESNVLARVVGAHEMMNSDVIVKICGDMPLLDPIVIDTAIKTYLDNDCIDVVTTARRRFFPDGVDAEVFQMDLLAEVANTVNDAEVCEHVTSHFYRPDTAYKVIDLDVPANLFAPDLRLVLDYAEDLKAIRTIFRQLLPNFGERFGTAEIIRLLRTHPEIAELNAQYTSIPSL